MQANIIDNITSLENLHWAWQKLKSAYANATDIWLNNIEIESFEGELEENLKKIKIKILQGNYKLSPIHPVAYPKMKDEKEGHRTRPAFYINVSDQLVWIAVLNIIGSSYDFQMPFWSFGHRLYITTWVEGKDSNGQLGKLKYGWYRNTTQNFYRNWKQSWPKFRRHIFLTIKAMSGRLFDEKDLDALSDQELRELESNREVKHFLKNIYLEKEYWPNKNSDLYWCSIDLKKFYPSIDRSFVLENIVKYNDDINKDDEVYNLISKLLDFKIAEDTGWNNDEIISVFGDEKDPQIGLPTGLIVSGFLSNIAMLEVDMEIQKKLIKKEFACFRFVDDHVVLAKNINDLKKWYKEYDSLLSSKLNGVVIGTQKTEPEEFRKWISGEEIDLTEVIKKCKLDPDNPTPLVTQTLLKLSLIAGQDISFLTDEESQNMINDLKHFLLTDFADHEIKKETQVSFALTMLSKLLPELKKDYSQVHRLRREKNLFENNFHERIKNQKYELDKKNGFLFKSMDDNTEVNKLIPEKEKRFNIFETEIEAEKNKADKKYNHQVQKFFLFFLNTVVENYSKPKLWLRLIEYCSRVGYENVIAIFDSVDTMKEKDEINEINYDSLNILCTTIISRISLKIVGQFYLQNKFIDKRKETFLKSLFTQGNINFILSRLEGNKYDMIITRKQFIITIKIVNDCIGSDLIKSNFNVLDKEVYSLNTSDKNELIFWIYKGICSPLKSNSYWVGLSNKKDYDKPLAKIISLLSGSLNNEMHDGLDYRIVNSKWESQNLNTTENKTLFNYLADCQKRSEDDLLFSEYAALCLTNELIYAVNKEFHDIFKKNEPSKFNFHPGCFKFNYPKSPINSWDALDNFFKSNRNKLFSYNQNGLIPDKRYLPDKILEYNDANIAEVYSIGVLLWQMCYKQSKLSNELFIDNGRFFINQTNNNDIKYFPSSYSEFIIRSCISPINRESTFWIDKRIKLKNYEHSLKVENEQKGFPPAILDIFELERRVNLAKELLKKDQLNIKDNIGRQLVYLCFQNPTALNDILRKNESKL